MISKRYAISAFVKLTEEKHGVLVVFCAFYKYDDENTQVTL